MGNSVDSGQRVFAMKTARKSSFCSGVTKNKKKADNKKEESLLYSFIFSPSGVETIWLISLFYNNVYSFSHFYECSDETS
jgi:hypothetical protein